MVENMDTPEAKADQFLQDLLTEGATTPCDDTSESFKQNLDTLPPFYDEKLFKRAQDFYYRNSFGVFGGKIYGLMSVLYIPTILRILVHTKKSGSEFTAYQRYVATIFHMVVWYESDFKPGSRLWRSIAEVRNKHNAASNSGCKAGLNRISQKDMALTQFGFMGFQLARGNFFGLQDANEEDWEGFVHLWRVVGHLMGIEDRFNICRGSVEDARAICEKLIDKVFIPHANRKDPESLQMIKYLINGLWAIMPLFNYNVLMVAFKMIVTKNTNMNDHEECKALTLWEKFLFFFIGLIFYSLRWAPTRWYFNHTRRRDLWLMRNVPFLGYYKYGFKRAYVRILDKSE